MDINLGKEYLGTYRILSTRIKRLKEMMNENPSRRQKYKAQIEECEKKREMLEMQIDSIDGGILSEIAALKYICGKTLEEISLIIGYCKRQTERLHLKALEKLSIA